MVPFSDQTPSATSKTRAGLTKAPRPPEGCRVRLRGHRAEVKSQPHQGGQWALGTGGGGAGCGPRPGAQRPRGHPPAGWEHAAQAAQKTRERHVLCASSHCGDPPDTAVPQTGHTDAPTPRALTAGQGLPVQPLGGGTEARGHSGGSPACRC